MNDSQVNTQIQQMVKFIEAEAQEKVNEIKQQTEEEFTIEKQKLVEKERQRLRREFERKNSQLETARKVQNSNDIKAASMKVLQARQEAMNEVLNECRRRLSSLRSNQKQYRALLKSLLLECMISMNEESLLVHCVKDDENIVKGIFNDVQTEFAGKRDGKIVTVSACELQLATGIDRLDEMNDSSGGIIATTLDRQIICRNTLEERLKLSAADNIPALRQMLFDE